MFRIERDEGRKVKRGIRIGFVKEKFSVLSERPSEIQQKVSALVSSSYGSEIRRDTGGDQ